MSAPLLLVPGPVPLHPQVAEELAKPALPHYGDAWVKADGEALELLRYTWEAPEGAGPGVARLRLALRRPAKAVVMVHNETSTGVTSPLEPIVEVAHERDAFVLVDAVSSFGGLPLPFARL